MIDSQFVANTIGRMARAALMACVTFSLCAQVKLGTITGVVTDPAGAVVPNARIVLSGPGGLPKETNPDGQGRFVVTGLPPGEYRLQIAADGFISYEATGLQIRAGGTLAHDARLAMASVRQEVTVADNTQQLDVDPLNNVGAVVLRGADLSALSDDPDDLAVDLQALAGPAAGPNGGEIFIDGFSGGRLPPKSSIREVRINQNPFSAEYDRLGFGRIEVFTRPGTDQFRGEARFDFGDSAFNSRNPFALDKPDYQRKMIEGNFGGPLDRRSSFMLQAERRDMQETSIINALVLDPSFRFTSFRQAVVTPTANTEFSLRLDYQLSTNHTLVGRYDWEDRSQRNAGLDTFSLPSRAFSRSTRDQRLQITETAVLSPSAIQELRFQYIRGSSTSQADHAEPVVQVPEAFTGGGAATGFSGSNENRWQLADLVSWIRNKHTIKFGGRLRGVTLSDRSMQNYNGMFTFNSLDSYRITQLGLRDGLTAQQIRALGGGASQFSMTVGDPVADVEQIDAGMFVQDDWRVHPQLTVTAGLRYEAQNNIGDRRNFAPRFAFAWAPGGNGGQSPVAVIRGGFGVFYDRVSESLTLQAKRLDGVRQKQYLVPAPDFFPNIPPAAVLAGNLRDQAIRTIDSSLRAPYTAQFAFSVERKLPKNMTLSVTYTNSRGVRTLRSRNINAPFPGTYEPLAPDSGTHPFGGGNIYLYESTGFFRQNQVIANLNARVNRRLNLFGYYTWNRANSDTDGAGSFPADQYSLAGEYARAGFDVRHRVFVGGSVEAPYRLVLSPFITASSGPPFNITAGQDLNGDSIFNDRPSWPADLSRASVIRTQYGVFDTNPVRGQAIVPRNLGSGPGQFTVNLRLSRSFGFGERAGQAAGQMPQGPLAGAGPGGGHAGPGGHGGGPGGHGEGHGGGPSASGSRYSVTFSVSARNLFNTVNLAPPVGNLSSPLFGTSMATAGRSSANRTVELQMRFSF